MTDARVTATTPVVFGGALPEAVDVVVLGGGVIGVFTALSLARAGQKVLLAEKGRIAGEQSSRNWGWIRQTGRDRAELPIMKRARGLWLEADRATNGATGVVPCGTYYIASSDKGVAEQEAWLSTAREFGLDTRALTKADFEEAFSGQAPERWKGGIVTPSDMRGEPWRAVPAVARLAAEAGAVIREDCAVRALDLAAGRVAGVVTEHGRVACAQVVVAGGAWSSLFLKNEGVTIPQLSVRATAVQTAPLPEFFAGAAADEDLALRRRDDGGYSVAPSGRHGFWIGPEALRHARVFGQVLKDSWRGTRFGLAAPKGFPDGWGTARRWAADAVTPFEAVRVLEPAPMVAELGRLCADFAERFPGIGRPQVRSAWAGMIDTMPDVVPVVDRVPEVPGLIVATGMSGHGFGIGPGFGEVVARMALGEAPEFDLARFRFGRFSDGSRLQVGDAL